jgi:hypothetical protein
VTSWRKGSRGVHKSRVNATNLRKGRRPDSGLTNESQTEPTEYKTTRLWKRLRSCPSLAFTARSNASLPSGRTDTDIYVSGYDSDQAAQTRSSIPLWLPISVTLMKGTRVDCTSTSWGLSLQSREAVCTCRRYECRKERKGDRCMCHVPVCVNTITSATVPSVASPVNLHPPCTPHIILCRSLSIALRLLCPAGGHSQITLIPRRIGSIRTFIVLHVTVQDSSLFISPSQN